MESLSNERSEKYLGKKEKVMFAITANLEG